MRLYTKSSRSIFLFRNWIYQISVEIVIVMTNLIMTFMSMLLKKYVHIGIFLMGLLRISDMLLNRTVCWCLVQL
ncbi:MAG: hypothetical protein AYW85_05370 [Bifidobacterium bifidum]|nr:MAG: hypothetical protein AYW85_05370 [Bifidobacterium bifidum]